MADTNSDKLDKIIRVVTRTEVQVEALMQADAHTRITKLESAHKFWKAVAIAIPPLGALILGCMTYFDN